MLNKNIAIILNTAWNVYNFRLGLIKELINGSAEIYIIAPKDDFVGKIISEVDCTFIPLNKLSRDGTNPINDYRLILELRKIFTENKIDLVLSYTIKPVIYGTIAARTLNIPVINTVTGLGYSFLSSGLVNKLVKSLYKFSLQYANVNLFQNIDDKELFIREKLVSEHKADIVNGSGINTTYFFPVEKKRTNDNVTIVFIGRLLYDKGIRELIEAATIVVEKDKRIYFEIIGGLDKNNPSGITKEELERLVRNNRISYRGKVKDTRRYIANSDMVVLPSYREGLPRVMLEAMSMARPIITTDVPGCRETVINEYNGLLVKAKDAENLANAILKLSNLSEEERKAMGKNGRKMTLEKFDEKIIIQKYLEVIDRVLI